VPANDGVDNIRNISTVKIESDYRWGLFGMGLCMNGTTSNTSGLQLVGTPIIAARDGGGKKATGASSTASTTDVAGASAVGSSTDTSAASSLYRFHVGVCWFLAANVFMVFPGRFH
jgi:hypothetical protein